jgi:hypothetical protein
MISLTPIALRCLEHAGWTEAYNWDPPGWREAVQAEGFHISRAAADFLRRFGGLNLDGPKVTFDPVAAARGTQPWAARPPGLEVGASVVGTDGGYLTVWVADDGRVCMSVDDDFWVIGDDAFDGLNAVCEGNDYQAVRARRHLTGGDGAE